MNKYFDAQKIDKYWRAANYLTVSFMYLKNNIFLEQELSINDLKEHPSGHWGTSPGINFIFAHLNNFIRKTSKQVQLIIGPGHAGNSVFVNLLLEGTLHKYYPIQLSKDEFFDIEKIHQCIAKIRTEGSPFLPGTIYDGGELGYSLPVAYGSVIDNPDLLTVCVIGDGEMETGTISSAWRCNKYWNPTCGMVLPIIHLNGFRMGDESLFSQYGDNDITLYFKSMGYEVRFISLNHIEMIDALNWTENRFKEIKQGLSKEFPVLILKSHKGCTAPDTDDICISGTIDSHKNPLKKLNKQEIVEYLKIWLNSYHPKELFEKKGFPINEILEILPSDNRKLGRTLNNYMLKKLELPAIKNFSIVPQNTLSNISLLENYLLFVGQKNYERFIIVSPDELKSNLLGGLKKLEGGFSVKPNRSIVMEILNENICQGWMQGYVMTGRNCLMIGYEAFMPIISSMVSQFSKWLYQANFKNWRTDIASLNYILTSLWEENTYSHQNPEFINNLLQIQYGFVRIYFPIDANSLLCSLQKCLLSKNRINAIIISKQPMPQMLDVKRAEECLEKGFVDWYFWGSPKEKMDIILVAVGDYATRECMEGIKIIRNYLPKINIKMISILDLTKFGDNKLYPHAINNEDFQNIFPERIPIVICFHGYTSALKSLLFERIMLRDIVLLGYENKSFESSGSLGKMILNGMSRYNIVLKACDLLRKKTPEQIIKKMKSHMKKELELT